MSNPGNRFIGSHKFFCVFFAVELRKNTKFLTLPFHLNSTYVCQCRHCTYIAKITSRKQRRNISKKYDDGVVELNQRKSRQKKSYRVNLFYVYGNDTENFRLPFTTLIILSARRNSCCCSDGLVYRSLTIHLKLTTYL